jgi:hypothetical protein
MGIVKLSSIFVLLLTSHSAHASSFGFEEDPEPVSLKDVERIFLAMSIPPSHCRPNGRSISSDLWGVLFNGEMIYFRGTEKRTIVQALTGQSNDLSVDVIQQLVLTQEDFDNLAVTLVDNGKPLPKYRLAFGKGNPALELSSSELVLVVHKLGKAFGLSEEEILEKINSLLGYTTD